MDRRTFVKRVCVQTTAFSAGSVFLRMLDPSTAKAETGKPDVSVARGVDYTKLVTDVLKPLGGIETIVKKGARVVVKPNIGWNRTPELAANTHPVIVKTIVKMALDAGASKVSVFDRTCNEERLCYNNSGIKAAVESINDSKVSCEYIDERKFIDVDISNGMSIDKWSFYKDVLEADCYINVPVAKHHGYTTLSLGLKNIMGVIGGNRGKIHHHIDQRIADLNRVVKSDIVIVDATRMLLRHGPQGGNPDDVKVQNTLVASRDIVAADAYATTLFGLKPAEIETTVTAHNAGLGVMDLDRINVINV